MKIRKRNRLQHYDYSQDGYYYITICTKNHRNWFGGVVEGGMVLNDLGEIVQSRILWIEEKYNYVSVSDFIVMPNHVHMILILSRADVVTGRDLSLQMKVKPISELIGALKTTSSKRIHNLGYWDFAWQRSFYDHVIRDEKPLLKIQEYIQNNPAKWELDKYNPKNLIQ